MSTPLAGVRVLDVTNVLSGPFASHQLAHLGADVIKVEARGVGDLARQLGAAAALNRAQMGASFLAQNAGKRSIALNLKAPAGVEVFRRLAAGAQVVLENFRPGVMTRLGLGYEQLLPLNPRLVYCAISGFGQDGPLRDLPAYDQIIQGMAGVMSITGAPDTAPYRVGYPVADTIGGLTAAMAICAALADRAREGGVFIDVSMLDATLATMGWAVSNHLVAGQTPQPLGNDNATASPSGAFRTADGLLNIAANQQQQFEALCAVIGVPALKDDPRFHDRQARLHHRAELQQCIEQQLAGASTADWWRRLSAAGVPAGPVYSVAQALAEPQVTQRGLIGSFAQVPGVGHEVRMLRTGLCWNGTRPSVSTPPPQLGEHTLELLAELGYDDDGIAALRRADAI